MADSTTFDVDLPQFQTAIDTVAKHTDFIHSYVGSMKVVFTAVEGAWLSPSGVSFASLESAVTKVTKDLTDLLDDALRRMRASYQSFSDAESDNHNVITS